MEREQAITQDELDTLLASIEVAERRQRANVKTATAALHDFRYANKLSPDHMRVMHGRLQALASVLNRTLGMYLNNTVEFRVHSIDIASHEQYIRNLPARPILGVVSYGRGLPQGLWEISGPLAYAALDCMLGGPGNGGEGTEVEPTPLERGVLTRLFQEILSSWTELWDRLQALQPRVEGVVCSATAVDPGPIDERLFFVVLEVTLGHTRGMMRLCIPLTAVKRLLREEKSGNATVIEGSQTPEALTTPGPLGATPVPVRAYLQPPPLPLSQLLELAPGDVLDLRLPVSTPFVVAMAESPKFEAQAGMREGRLAVRLGSRLSSLSKY